MTCGWEFAIVNPDKEELSRHKITENTIFTNSYPYFYFVGLRGETNSYFHFSSQVLSWIICDTVLENFIAAEMESIGNFQKMSN